MMYAGKLPVVFLSSIVSESDDATNCQIANYILDHLSEMRDITISALAKQCHVSNSSISRFCRAVGLEDFSELREMLTQEQRGIPVYSDAATMNMRGSEYGGYVVDALNEVLSTLDYAVLESLVSDIAKYDKISIFGLLKAGSAAVSLQNDLMLLGKRAVTKIAYGQQMEYLKELDEEKLIIIFSYTGVYFDYGSFRQQLTERRKARIYFITSDSDARKKKYYDRVLYFQSRQDYASHPYQLLMIANLIAQEYARSLSLKTSLITS